MLVGRHAELARLESLIGATRAGSGSAVLLQGVAGVGKTALLDHSAGPAADLVVLRATGIPGEAEVAFAGLLEVLRPLLHRLPELPSPQREVLSGALGLAPAAERDRFLTGAATLALLLVAAATGRCSSAWTTLTGWTSPRSRRCCSRVAGSRARPWA